MAVQIHGRSAMRRRRLGFMFLLAVTGVMLPFADLAYAANDSLRDRFADLYKAAAKEGEVVFYTDGRQDTAERISKFWKQAFPEVKLVIVPKGSPALIAQVETEHAAGQYRVDVTHMSQTYVANLWKTKGFYITYKVATFDKFRPHYADEEGAYYTSELYVLPAAYNTKQFPDAKSLPMSVLDFLDPKWKGKIVLPDPTSSGNTLTFLMTMLSTGSITWTYLEKLATQEVLFVRGNPDAVRMLASGERSVAPILSSFNIMSAKAKGQPIDYYALKEGVVVVQSAMGIMERAPHPNGAKLLMEALTSAEGGTMLSEGGAFWPANPDSVADKSLPKLADLRPIQPQAAGSTSQKDVDDFLAHFKQVFHRR